MFKKILHKEIVDYSRTLSMLLLSRISILQALELIGKQTKNFKLKEINKKILSDIKSGHSISKSFSKHPDLFGQVFIANLEVAEETGQIAEVLSEYTIYLEKIQSLKRKIAQALRYPLFILFVAISVVVFMLTFIVPTFENLFSSMKADLPLITVYLLFLSNLMIENSALLIIIFSFMLIACFLFLKDKNKLYNAMDKIIWKMPLISTIYLNNLLARFSLSMGILLKSKITLVDALKISKNVTTSKSFKLQIDSIVKKLVRGESLSSFTDSSKFFDMTFSKLIAVGEESAELDKVFILMSDYYNNEFDYRLDNITSLIEPVLIIGVGLLVSIILIALYLPMFEIINHFGV